MTEQRTKILACACDLYLKEGPEGFSMRKLAREVGVTAPALYRHYESKERVLIAVVSEAFKILSQYLYRALEGVDPWDRYSRAGRAYLDFALDHPRLYEMIYASCDSMGFDQQPPEIEAQACAVGQFFHDRVRECMDAGIIEPGIPEDVSITFWAHAHGLISIYLKKMVDRVEQDDEFRVLYDASCERLAVGVMTEEFRATRAQELVTAASE